MFGKKILPALVIVGVFAASASTAANARDHHRDGGAIAAGIIGAVVVGSLIANSQPTYAAPQPYYQQPNTYYQQQPNSYYQAPAQTYYSPQPVQQVYYQQAQPYYAPSTVIYSSGGYRDRHDYRRYHHRDRNVYYQR